MASLVTLNQIAAPGFEKLQIIMRVDFLLTLLNVQTKITWSMKSLPLTKIMNQYPTNLEEDWQKQARSFISFYPGIYAQKSK